MSNAPLKSSLLKYVERNSDLYGIEWDPNISEQLPFDPFDTSDQSRKITRIFSSWLLQSMKPNSLDAQKIHEL
jgi:hypothetical protein